MDLNLEYAAHQHAIMDADAAATDDDRLAKLEEASRIATRITEFQYQRGAAAACAWSKARFVVPARPAPS